MTNYGEKLEEKSKDYDSQKRELVAGNLHDTYAIIRGSYTV